LLWCLPAAVVFASERLSTEFGLEFVHIPAGEFTMGTEDFEQLIGELEPDKVANARKETPAHKVIISRSFYLSTTEVTQKMWLDLMNDRPGKEKRWQRADWADLPVSRVSWESVKEFIDELNSSQDRFLFRLPTEAEWEYAARAGTRGLRPFPYAQMGDHAWYRGNGDKPMPVASRQPNAWGLFDMLGNVWEWVEDSYDPGYYRDSPAVDPIGPAIDRWKVMRGGSYHCTPERVRVAIRGSWVQDRSLSILGFRLAADRRD
jgi:formylglycine-generating enzyme required for sulfatase activity